MRAEDLEIRVCGLKLRAYSSGFLVQGSGITV
jgi:hypothetical protein